MQTTICGRIFPSSNQAKVLDSLMRRQSSCMRIAYNRLCEGKTKTAVERTLREIYPEINTRYRKDAYFRAHSLFKLILRLVEKGVFSSPNKVIFGKRRNLERRKRGQISPKKWKELRNNQLLSRGDKSKKGNLNLRIVKIRNEYFLRVNTGTRKWLFIPVYVPHYLENLESANYPYGVRLQRFQNQYRIFINFQLVFQKTIGFRHGAVGIDFNHNTIDLAVINSQGQLKNQFTINCQELTCARRGKREWLIGNIVKRIVKFAKYWNRGLVAEDLKNVTIGQSNQHQFSYRKFLEALQRRAEREGVSIRLVNPAYTSVIGLWKYVPYYHITVHQAAALVVARRGKGFTERLRKLKSLVLEPMEGEETRENVHSRRVHSWHFWRSLGRLPSHKGTNSQHFNQSYSMDKKESWRTKNSNQRSLSKDGLARRKIVIPSSGPSNQDVNRTPQFSLKNRKSLSTRPKSYR